VLHECKLIPRIVSGASSGSIVAAMLCTRTDEELPLLLNPGHLNLVFIFLLTSLCDFVHQILQRTFSSMEMKKQICS
jgi:predicted acylesterase/phospholipase RssA